MLQPRSMQPGQDGLWLCRDPQLIACMGGQGVFRHQLLSNLTRERRFEASLDVDLSQFFLLELDVVA